MSNTPTQIGAFFGMMFLLIISLLLSLVFWIASFWYWPTIITSGLCLILALLVAWALYRETKP